jgi:hypothetical protein
MFMSVKQEPIMTYIVWTPRKRRFASLTAASEYANEYFQRTGVIVAITLV